MYILYSDRCKDYLTVVDAVKCINQYALSHFATKCVSVKWLQQSTEIYLKKSNKTQDWKSPKKIGIS